MVINPIVGVYIPIIRIPYSRLDDHTQYKEFRPWLKSWWAIKPYHKKSGQIITTVDRRLVTGKFVVLVRESPKIPLIQV